MGVVFGKIKLSSNAFNYEYIKSYCESNKIKLTFDDVANETIGTDSISFLKAFNNRAKEIKGEGNNIEGSDKEGYTITILGISYPFFENEFPNHVK